MTDNRRFIILLVGVIVATLCIGVFIQDSRQTKTGYAMVEETDFLFHVDE